MEKWRLEHPHDTLPIDSRRHQLSAIALRDRTKSDAGRSIVRRINRLRFGSSFLEPAARPHLRGSSAETVFSVLKCSINRKRVARLTPSATHASGTAVSGNRPGWSRIKLRSISSRRQASAHSSSRIFEEELVMSLTRIRGESDLKVASHLSHENVNAPIHISTKTSVSTSQLVL